MGFGNEQEFIDFQEAKERREQAMKCPLFCMNREHWELEDPTHLTDCLKEECGWWNDILKECRFVSADRRLGEIANFLGAISVKMPHAGQFKK